MKELTRQWLAGKLSHLYANRVLTLRAPARLCPERPVVMQSKETFVQTRLARPDPLNPPSARFSAWSNCATASARGSGARTIPIWHVRSGEDRLPVRSIAISLDPFFCTDRPATRRSSLRNLASRPAAVQRARRELDGRRPRTGPASPSRRREKERRQVVPKTIFTRSNVARLGSSARRTAGAAG